MKSQVSVVEVQDVLDEFVRAGLVCAQPTPHASNWRGEFGARQRTLIKTVIEEFCPRFVAGGTVV